MKTKSIVITLCVVSVAIFIMSMILGYFAYSGSEQGSVTSPGVSGIFGIFVSLLFLLVCFFLLPCWAWFKGKRFVLATVLAVVSVFFIAMIISYLRDPEATSDNGMVVIGFISIVPLFTFFLHLIMYGVAKYVSHRRMKH